MIKHYSILLFAITLILLGCETEQQTNGEQATISIEQIGANPLIDVETPIGQPREWQFLNGDSLVIRDNSGQLFLFHDHTLVRKIGRSGEAECEYGRVLGIHSDNERLYVLDTANSKIIIYDLRETSCEREIRDDRLYAFSGMTGLGGDILALRGRYHRNTPDSTELAYKLEGDDLRPIGLTKERLAPLPLPAPMNRPIPTAQAEDKLYMSFPMTQSLMVYDNVENEISNFWTNIELPDAFTLGRADGDEGMHLLSTATEHLLRLYTVDNHIAFYTRKGSYPDIEWKIWFYNYDGSFVGNKEVPLPVVHVSNEQIVMFERSGSDEDYPFELVTADYSIGQDMETRAE